jgi:hypothetical protein
MIHRRHTARWRGNTYHESVISKNPACEQAGFFRATSMRGRGGYPRWSIGT